MNIIRKISTFLIACLFGATAFAADTKPLILATEATYPPFESINSQGQMIGFDVDVLTAICAHIQRTCRFISQPWDSLLPGLQLGKFDVSFGAMNITAERQKQVDFTQPYYVNTGTLVAPKSANLSFDLASLKGKTIGVQSATTTDYYLNATYGKNIRINRYGSIQDAFLDLQSGRIDAVFGDTPTVLTWLKMPANSGIYVTVGQPIQDEQFFNKGYGFAVKKGNTELLNQLNKGIDAIKADGTYQKIVSQYFGNLT
jgi:arginine transport system substrate-binding protein